MKKNVRKIISIVVFFFGIAAWGQTVSPVSETPQIQLPDITTTIEKEQSLLDSDAIPQIIVPVQTESTQRLPELPAFIIPPEVYTVSDTVPVLPIKDSGLYIAGNIGGGYPGMFTGGFSLYQLTGKPDFNLTFLHNSVMGYGTHSASLGYLDTDTILQGSAEFLLNEILVLGITGNYSSNAIGMQSKSLQYFNSSIQYAFIQGDIQWTLPLNMQLNGKIFMQTSEQILGFTKITAPNEYKGISTLIITPQAQFLWTYDAFSTSFSAQYHTLQYVHIDDEPLHRGEFMLAASFTPSAAFSTNASAGFIASRNGILVPFSLQGTLDITDMVFVSISGGLRSTAFDSAAGLKEEPFLHLKPVYAEQSDWFAALEARVPIMSSFEAFGIADFEKTAFGNGQVVSNYEAFADAANEASGLFLPVIWDRTQLHTMLGVSYGISVLTASAVWDARWFDIPKTKQSQQIIVGVAVDPKDENGILTQKWGAEASCAIAFSTDFMPKLDISGFYSIFQGLRISAQLTDVVSLFSNTDRIRAKPYIDRGMTGVLKLEILF